MWRNCSNLLRTTRTAEILYMYRHGSKLTQSSSRSNYFELSIYRNAVVEVKISLPIFVLSIGAIFICLGRMQYWGFVANAYQMIVETFIVF